MGIQSITDSENSRLDSLLTDDREDQEGGMGNFATAFTLFKGFVGAGILFLPNGFYEAGWLFGIISMLISCTITFYFIYLLIKVKYEVGGTYGDIGYKAWGRFGRICTDLAITVA